MINKKSKIGIIGTGIIGLPIAKNLLKNKYNVLSYVRDVKKHNTVKKSGIKIIDDISEFFGQIDVLILAVSETKDVKKILLGPKGLIKNKIKPALKSKFIVICDRFTDSTLAYQVFGKKINIKFINNIHKFILNGIKPNITFVLKVSINSSRKRLNKRKSKNR